MKKSELKTEIRNRILEKKSKVEENTVGSLDITKVADADALNAFRSDKASGIDAQIKSALNAFEDVIDYMEIEDFNRLKNDTLKFLVSKEQALKNKVAEPEEEEEEDKDEVEEISTSAGAGAYQTKYAFKLPKDYKKAKEVNEGIIEPKSKKKA